MVSKIALVLFVCLAIAHCEPPTQEYGAPFGGNVPISSYGTPNYNAQDGHHGSHGDYNDHSEPKSYEFGYQVKDDYTGTNYKRQEASDGNQVKGEYRVALPDGRTQIVTYYADWQTGFHADVRYEGTAQYPETYNNNAGYPSGPANVPLNNEYGAPSYNSYNSQPSYNPSSSYNAPSLNQGSYNSYNSPATSSVSIKDFSGPSTAYNTGSYNNKQFNNGYDYNAGQGYNYQSPNKFKREAEVKSENAKNVKKN